MDENQEKEMDIQLFSERIQNSYLPFTLRRMYYRELKMRKPLFVGLSKKGIGFDPNPRRVNSRTSKAQQEQLVKPMSQDRMW